MRHLLLVIAESFVTILRFPSLFSDLRFIVQEYKKKPKVICVSLFKNPEFEGRKEEL